MQSPNDSIVIDIHALPAWTKAFKKFVASLTLRISIITAYKSHQLFHHLKLHVHHRSTSDGKVPGFDYIVNPSICPMQKLWTFQSYNHCSKGEGTYTTDLVYFLGFSRALEWHVKCTLNILWCTFCNLLNICTIQFTWSRNNGKKLFFLHSHAKCYLYYIVWSVW